MESPTKEIDLSRWFWIAATAGVGLIGASYFFSYTKRPTGYNCVTVEDPKDGKIYRSKFIGTKEELVDFVETIDKKKMYTTYELLEHAAEKYGKEKYLGTQIGDPKNAQYKWKTYKEVQTIRTQIGSGLISLGFKEDSALGIFAKNREEWIMFLHGCEAYSMRLVPLYDTLGKESIEHIISLTELELICVDSEKTLDNLAVTLKELKEKGTNPVKYIIYFDSSAAEKANKIAKEFGLKGVLSFEELRQKGEANIVEHIKPKPDTVNTICFTSGTTGLPKGVILTHRNLVSVAGSIKPQGIEITHNDVHYSYLPLAHVLERAVQLAFQAGGCAIGFFSGSVDKMPSDLSVLKPTLFIGVPRIYNRIYHAVWDNVNKQNFFLRNLFHFAYAVKKFNMKTFGTLKHSLFDALVFSKVRARFGGRVRKMLTGSAPIQNDVLEFTRICFSAEVYEGYGQTEGTGGSCITLTNDYSVGHVGAPLACVEIKLRKLEKGEGMTSHQDEDGEVGEICLRGPSIFSGYFKQEEKTKETLKDGWALTGDVGVFTKHGNLKIVGRTKDIFKLSQGEYIAPEKLENIYGKSEWISYIYVHGNSTRRYLVAMISPDKNSILAYASKNGLGEDYDAILRRDDIYTLIKDDLERLARQHNLTSLERIKTFSLTTEEWTVDNNLLTPTLKLKRPEVHNKYKKELDALYETDKESI